MKVHSFGLTKTELTSLSRANTEVLFTEDFTAERLALVFGNENVLTNIDIFDGKDKAGEIDVLVTFDCFAIVVQAKSKKLTIEARKR